MAAPQSNPDLSVVSTEENAGAAETAPAPSPERSSGESVTPRRRKSVPIWVLLAVAVVGLLAFFNQYQRAEGLDARVNSLVGELEVAGERLEAYRAHLSTVRLSVGDLSERVGSLKSLVDRDPLATTDAVDVAPLVGSASSAPSPSTPSPATSEKGSTHGDTGTAAATSGRESVSWEQAAGAFETPASPSLSTRTPPTPMPGPTPPSGDRAETNGLIRERALSTPFTPESVDLGLHGDALPDLDTLLAPDGPHI
jgi:hypothetical protein